MELRSQAVRKLAPENDPLKIGMGWKVDDLAKPQIMVESTFGDSHPGSAHLDQFVKEAVQAVNTHGGKAARYFATDMCDGIAQGHDGINYSLPHRDAIVNLVEAQANATVYDGGVFIASCDKSMPAMLMSIGRLKDMSAIVVTGGVMEAHTLPKKYVVNDPACAINDLLTLEQIGKFDAWEKTGVIPNEQLDYYKHNACPSCGACSFMGTASTMQIMAEALGLMLPGTALMPATAPELKQAAYDAGKQLMELVKKGITAKDIVTKKSFENAIMVHAAISGSTNATMHLPAIAHEFGIEIDADALVTFSVEKNRNNVEITVHAANTYFRASESTSDMFASIDAAVATIERQIRKNKTRLARRLRQDAFVRTPDETSFAPEEPEEGTFELVRTKKFNMKPMTREEAILQMNLLEHTFFAFRDEDNDGAFAVVYKRTDGGYGLIEDVA